MVCTCGVVGVACDVAEGVVADGDTGGLLGLSESKSSFLGTGMSDFKVNNGALAGYGVSCLCSPRSFRFCLGDDPYPPSIAGSFLSSTFDDRFFLLNCFGCTLLRDILW